MSKDNTTVAEPTNQVDTSDASPVQPSRTSEFVKMPALKLSEVNVDELSDEDAREYAKAAQAAIGRAVKGGIFVDTRNGIVYGDGKQLGNVNRPTKAAKLIPAAYGSKEEYIDAGGKLNLPSRNLTKGRDDLLQSVITVTRLFMAGTTGNGVSLVGQSEKTPEAAANAMGAIKGGLA